ncbi:hypothetical protein ES705_24863 [subsurface metagenome]
MGIDGSNFTATERTDDSVDKMYPQLQVVGNMIYFVFVSSTSPVQLFTASMGTDGSNWSATQRTDFTHPMQNVSHPQLQVVEGKIYYIFQAWENYSIYQIYTALMDIGGANFLLTKETTRNSFKTAPQLQVYKGAVYYIWSEKVSGCYQIWTSENDIMFSYGEWLKFTTAAPGSPGDRPSGYKNDVCSDNSGYTYILNRSLTDDGESYESYFVLSTDLSGKKTLHTNKRLLDIFSYFANEGKGTAKVSLRRDNEPTWQEAGEISLAGEEEIIIQHLPVDFLAKTYLIKFVFWNNFEFIGMITEAIPIGDKP